MQNWKRLSKMETDTGSCGGFAGISDAFGSALWGLDHAFQMAYNNFGGAMIHVGGQNVFYNPFTPPPTNQSTFHQWTVGRSYYTALVAESLGPSNGTQVLDLGANDFTPCYNFYENRAPVGVGCINYVTDPTGASDLKVQIAIGGSGIGRLNQSPATVKVKCLLASSVSQKAGQVRHLFLSFPPSADHPIPEKPQTFGDNFASDGWPVGDINITTHHLRRDHEPLHGSRFRAVLRADLPHRHIAERARRRGDADVRDDCAYAVQEHRDGGPGCARDVEWGIWEEVGEHEFWEHIWDINNKRYIN
ncbi:hypothetical protein C0993_010243 [Termitomyces sp. T159_Od127]|nr:hypothetical protein C0993_010243 [Termitomyces sp. T159_Od127]